jgi:hypothetical protein
VIVLLNLVLIFSLELPIRLVDEDKDAWPTVQRLSVLIGLLWTRDLHSIVQDKELFSGILHDFVAKMPHQEGDGSWCTELIVCGQRKRVFFLVAEQDLKAPTANISILA